MSDVDELELLPVGPSNTTPRGSRAPSRADSATSHDSGMSKLSDYVVDSLQYMSHTTRASGYQLQEDYLSCGFFSGAIDRSRKKRDAITWAAALCLGGHPTHATKALEAAVVAADARARLPGDTGSKADLRLRHQTMTKWLERHQAARWLCIAAALDSNFVPPVNADVKAYLNLDIWVRHAEFKAARKVGPTEVRNVFVKAMQRLMSEQQRRFSECIIAWMLSRYHSAIAEADAYLSNLGGRPATEPDDILVRFARMMCLINVQEHALAESDAKFLLCSGTKFQRAVGHAVSAALRHSQPTLDHLYREDRLSPEEVKFVYFIAIYVETLLFTQCGRFQAAQRHFQEINVHVPSTPYWGSRLYDAVVCANVAARNKRDLGVNFAGITGQLHVWLSHAFAVDVIEEHQRILAVAENRSVSSLPTAISEADPAEAFLRMLEKSGCCVREDATNSSERPGTAELARKRRSQLLAEDIDTSLMDARCAIASMYVRGRLAIEEKEYGAAWGFLIRAAAHAEELVGSVDFALTLCSPPRIFADVVSVGRTFLEYMVDTTETKQQRCFVEAEVDKRVSLLTKNYPNFVGTFLARAYQAAGRKDFSEALQSATAIAIRFDGSIYGTATQSCLLGMAHRDSEALEAAERLLGMYPHSTAAQRTFRALAESEATMMYRYRGCLPLILADGAVLWHYVRDFTMGILAGLHLLFIVFTAAATGLAGGASNSPSPTGTLARESAGTAGTRPLITYAQHASWIPYIFALLFFIHCIFSTIVADSFVGTVLRRLRFRNSYYNRALFSYRGIFYCNAVTLLVKSTQTSSALVPDEGDVDFYRFVSLIFLLCLFPASTRFWYLTSEDEPLMGPHRWLGLFVLDALASVVTVPVHFGLVLLEPACHLVFFILRTADIGNSTSFGPLGRWYFSIIETLLRSTIPSSRTKYAGLHEDLVWDRDVMFHPENIDSADGLELPAPVKAMLAVKDQKLKERNKNQLDKKQRTDLTKKLYNFLGAATADEAVKLDLEDLDDLYDDEGNLRTTGDADDVFSREEVNANVNPEDMEAAEQRRKQFEALGAKDSVATTVNGRTVCEVYDDEATIWPTVALYEAGDIGFPSSLVVPQVERAHTSMVDKLMSLFMFWLIDHTTLSKEALRNIGPATEVTSAPTPSSHSRRNSRVRAAFGGNDALDDDDVLSSDEMGDANPLASSKGTDPKNGGPRRAAVGTSREGTSADGRASRTAKSSSMSSDGRGEDSFFMATQTSRLPGLSVLTNFEFCSLAQPLIDHWTLVERNEGARDMQALTSTVAVEKERLCSRLSAVPAGSIEFGSQVSDCVTLLAELAISSSSPTATDGRLLKCLYEVFVLPDPDQGSPSDLSRAIAKGNCFALEGLLIGLKVLSAARAVQLSESIFQHPTHRLPLARVMLNSRTRAFDGHKPALQLLSSQFAESIAFEGGGNANEFAAERFLVLDLLKDHRVFGGNVMMEELAITESLEDGHRFFTRAAAKGDERLLQWLFQNNLSGGVDNPLPDGRTALSHAIVGNLASTVRLLVSFGASTNAPIRGESNMTPAALARTLPGASSELLKLFE